MPIDLSQHPCFNDEARHSFGRIHLPVAPKCNVQCNFCDRQYDCVNESRPGVTSVVLSPGQSLWYLKEAVAKDPRLTVVGIAGPGDPFANAEETMETLRLVRREYPEMLLCLASNGLNVPPHVDEIAELDVTHVTITVNAVDPEIGAKVYAWYRDGKRVMRGVEGAALLWERQKESIQRLAEKDVLVKINTIIIPGVNDHHVEEVARVCKELGATILNAIPLYPVEGTPFGELGSPSAEEVKSIRDKAGEHMKLMLHCQRCRADAVGCLGEAMSLQMVDTLRTAACRPLDPNEDRPYVAVASHEGLLVNQHLGEAPRLLIYEKIGETYREVEERSMPPRGGGDQRWADMAGSLKDCRAVLVASAGQTPIEALKAHGVRVLLMEGLIEEGLEAVYSGRTPKAPCRKHTCGASCSGDGMGCG